MKIVWSLAVLACFAGPAFGQVPSSEEPGAIASRFEQPVAPRASSAGLLRLPEVPTPELLANVSIHLARVKVVGSTVYDDVQFKEIYGELLGRTVTVAMIYGLAQKITKLYGDGGYVLSRAIVPPQEIDPGAATITIQVSEAYIDQVVWSPTGDHYRDLFAGYTQKITAERPSNIKTVMRYLLLADDLPGINVSSRFEASPTNPRASSLFVDIKKRPVDVVAQVDNRGTEARGPWQYLLSATFNNLLGLHEALTTTIAGAIDTHELTYVSANYRQVLNDEGLSLFSDVSYSWGAPGTAALQAVMFSSTSLQYDIGLSAPVIRSRDTNLTLSALAFLSSNQAEMLGAPSSDDRLRGVRATATFDHADELDGVTQISATFSQGFIGFGSSSNGDPLLSREHGRVDFSKLEASINRTQKLGHGVSLYAAAEGQYAFTPLLSPEECGYGGKTFGRAFDPSEITGDNCLLASGELRFDPDIPNNPLTNTQLYAFVDYGTVFRIAPSAGTPTTAAGASAGLGLRLGNDNFSADLSAAKPLLGRIDEAWRFFVTAAARY